MALLQANAILNKTAAIDERCVLYTSLYPCNECAKLVVQCGIREVVSVRSTVHNRSKNDSVPTFSSFAHNFCGWGIRAFAGVYGMASLWRLCRWVDVPVQRAPSLQEGQVTKRGDVRTWIEGIAGFLDQFGVGFRRLSFRIGGGLSIMQRRPHSTKVLRAASARCGRAGAAASPKMLMLPPKAGSCMRNAAENELTVLQPQARRFLFCLLLKCPIVRPLSKWAHLLSGLTISLQRERPRVNGPICSVV